MPNAISNSDMLKHIRASLLKAETDPIEQDYVIADSVPEDEDFAIRMGVGGVTYLFCFKQGTISIMRLAFIKDGTLAEDAQAEWAHFE